MKSAVGLSLGLLAVVSLFAFAGCGDDDDTSAGGSGGTTSHGGAVHGGASTGGAEDGAVECQVIGELCHEADTGSGPGHDCHEVGHEADGVACLKEFSSCIATCVPDESGAGGAGSDMDPRCAALGELCHPVDDQTGPLHDCHEVGHEGDGDKCAAAFDDCAMRCLAARELLEAGEGTGGAGGAGTTAGGASMTAAGVGSTAGGVGAGGAP
jgi:hypothetical protein